MKKNIYRVLAGFLVLLIIAISSWYWTVFPRHYDTDEFEDLEAIAYAAENLRLAELRGVISRDYLTGPIYDLTPQHVRVYPTGVLIRLHGFFTYESGLYIPRKDVAANIEKMSGTTYVKLGYGVYSYKVEG